MIFKPILMLSEPCFFIKAISLQRHKEMSAFLILSQGLCPFHWL
jgi:hypothetical protein